MLATDVRAEGPSDHPAKAGHPRSGSALVRGNADSSCFPHRILRPNGPTVPLLQRSPTTCTARRLSHPTLLLGALLIVTTTSGIVTAAEPSDGLQGLGFSIAPKQGGKARTSLFGLVGEGYKFVYVFDRSGSMGGSGQNALRAVKAELLRSLANLDTVHQFQIIFYNERPAIFNPTGTPGRLAFATEANKSRAVRFIDSITAEGGTAHEEALRLATGLQPDVIFFLTDADDPKLTLAQLEKIRHLAAGIIINAIEFGPGPKPTGDSFLAQLARQNGGGYTYVSLSSGK
jgi:hypothetical protein